jgi:hypothetical protein
MKKIAFAAAAIAALAAASTAGARPSCDDFLCAGNGPQLTGIAPSAVKAKQPAVKAVTLPSGDTVDLR